MDATRALNTLNLATINVPGQGSLLVHYVDVLQALIKYVFVQKLGDNLQDDLDDAFLENPQVTHAYKHPRAPVRAHIRMHT